MQRFRPTVSIFLSTIVSTCLFTTSFADTESAQLAMEDPQNPLLLLSTSRGEIYVELFPNEAPNNVANIMALAAGEISLVDPNTSTSFNPRYFDGMRFHRVIPGFVIQAGSPLHNPLGAPDQILADEINADYLGLDQQTALNPDGSFNAMLNISRQEDFEEQILKPIYQSMDIESAAELLDRQYDVLQQLQGLSVKQVYQNQGYRYQTGNPSRSISRGVVALANHGPDTNGPEFFIALGDYDWLTGKHTVIGRVVEGMEVADTIGSTAVNPLRSSRLSTVIYSVRRLN
jgi:cyclophilin family peptidyl-prolyl cis-trans isomerase